MHPRAVVRSVFATAAALAAGLSAGAPTPPALPVASKVAAPSAPLADACPAQLPVKQTVATAIPGWTAQDQQGNYPFQRVAFYPGSPGDPAAVLIVPTVEYKGQTGLHDGWDLPRRPGGYWMTCAYGNTTATVARKLADDVDFCQADYDGRFITLVVRHWSCGVKRLMPPPVWSRPATPPPSKAPPPKRTR